MAAIEVVVMPPPPPLAPVVRISPLALAAADTVVCLWIASLWVLPASLAAAMVGFLTCGLRCAGAAWTVVLVSLLVDALVWPLAAALLTKFEVEAAFHYINQLQKGAAALEPISEGVILAHFIAIASFVLLEVIASLLQLLALVTKDPPTERVATVTMVVPAVGISAMCCLVSIPGLAVRVWRMRRHGRASVVPI